MKSFEELHNAIQGTHEKRKSDLTDAELQEHHEYWMRFIALVSEGEIGADVKIERRKIFLEQVEREQSRRAEALKFDQVRKDSAAAQRTANNALYIAIGAALVQALLTAIQIVASCSWCTTGK